MAVNDVYRLAMEGTLFSQQIVNVLHYQLTADPTLSFTAQSLINGWTAAVIPTWRAAVVDSYVLVQVSCTRIHPVGPATVITPFAGGTVGARASPPLPSNVAASIVKRTALIGRRHRGRMSLAGLANADNVGGLLSAGAFGLVQDLANVLEDLVVTPDGDARPVVWTRHVDVLPANSATPITDMEPQTSIRVQRTRTIGYGA